MYHIIQYMTDICHIKRTNSPPLQHKKQAPYTVRCTTNLQKGDLLWPILPILTYQKLELLLCVC